MKADIKSTLYPHILAGVLSVTQPVFSQENQEIESVQSQVSNNISSLVLPYQDIINLSKKREIDKGVDAREDFFPSSPKSIGLSSLSNAILENMKYNAFDVINPPFVDHGWFERVYCAGTVKGFLGSAKVIGDRTKAENNYFLRQGIDAWMLPSTLQDSGMYYRVYDFKKYFNLSKIGEREIIKDSQAFEKELIELGEYLKTSGESGGLLFLYFKLSDYKDTVRNYNQIQFLRNKPENISANTHQAIFLGNSFIEFKASEIKNFEEYEQEDFTKALDLKSFLANFIQQRSGYKSGFSKQTRQYIFKNISKYITTFEIEINGKKIELQDYFIGIQDINISPNDVIKISGPMFMDGFHDANNPNKYISKHNHARVMFYFEFLSIGSYTPSEFFSPTKRFNQKFGEKDKYEDILSKIQVKNLYYLEQDESLVLRLREAILRYHFGKREELKIGEEELSLYNKVATRNSFENRKKLIEFKNNKIDEIFKNLSSKEKREFESEYQKQIYGLQLSGYIQSESILNPDSVNINAPIPYFDTHNLNEVFQEYIFDKKIEISLNYKEDPNKDSIRIYFYPGDNFGKIYTQIQEKLSYYGERYKNFQALEQLDLLKRMKLIDIIIDRYAENNLIDVTNGKIPSMQNLKIPFDFLDTVLEELLKETYIDELKLSQIDEIIISKITNNKQDFDLLAHILVNESYEKGIPIRKILKKIGGHFGKVSSHGDFQMRLLNLVNPENALVRFPTIDDLLKSVSYLEDEDIKNLIKKRELSYGEDIEKDLKIIKTLQEKLKYAHYYTQEQKAELGREVYDMLKELFRFNDSRQINIVGKIIQTSLILDKIHEHYFNLNAWIENSGVSIDDVIYNNDYLQRYNKLLLVINNRAEKTTLIGTAENYILRILKTAGRDIYSKEYPKLEKNYKGQIFYSQELLPARFEFYINEIQKLNISDDKKENIIGHIKNIIHTNFSAVEIYKLFKEESIREVLRETGGDDFFMPTISELEDKGFRGLFFDYAKTPHGFEPPKNYNNIIEKAGYGFISFFSLLGIGITRRLFKKQSKKHKPS